jgi:hypothetical protein
MSQGDFKKLFGVLFTAFIIIVMFVFLLVGISDKLSIVATVILIVTPLIIRYLFYKVIRI